MKSSLTTSSIQRLILLLLAIGLLTQLVKSASIPEERPGRPLVDDGTLQHPINTRDYSHNFPS